MRYARAVVPVLVGWIVAASPAFAGVAAGQSWSIQPSRDITKGPSDSRLTGVSCASASDCMAAGSFVDGSGIRRTLIESWNGGSWSIEPSPNQGAGDNSLLDISCVSASVCNAVGYYANAQDTDQTLIESWNGTTWSVVPSPNKGSDQDFLLGVSCTSADSCTAAGSYVNASGVEQTLIESWDGSSWVTVTSPNRGASHNRLYDVSCLGTDCTAVGDYVNGVNVAQTLVESWHGASWSIVASPDKGTSSNYLFSVSCVSAGACTAVGGYINKSSVERTLVESLDGGNWSIVASPNSGKSSNFLLGVSCVAVTRCMAAGAYYDVGADSLLPLIASWDGATWSILTSPIKGTGGRLAGVSCVSAHSCTTVGFFLSSNDLVGETLIESWNGTSWAIMDSPNPPEVLSDELSAVSCVSASDCTAVGSYSDAGGNDRTLVEHWNGTRWSIVRSPNEGMSAGLAAVSCVSATACTAVGSYLNSDGLSRTLIESWNGSKWSIVPSPNNPNFIHDYLSGVSCVSAHACTTVGAVSSFSGIATLIESWNGTKWSIVASPNNGKSSLRSVACVSATSCTAVGTHSGLFGQGHLTLVESWNGSTWSIVASPNQAGNNNVLSGVSCSSASACTAVGDFVNGSSTHQTLVESWNGTTWSIVASPNQGGNHNVLSGVSCSSASACTSVGDFVNGSSTYQTLVESWNGSAWSIVASPNQGGNNNVLSGVSCSSASACTAVGDFVNGKKGVTRTLVESGP
jgi:hypothetical protein